MVGRVRVEILYPRVTPDNPYFGVTFCTWKSLFSQNEWKKVDKNEKWSKLADLICTNEFFLYKNSQVSNKCQQVCYSTSWFTFVVTCYYLDTQQVRSNATKHWHNPWREIHYVSTFWSISSRFLAIAFLPSLLPVRVCFFGLKKYYWKCIQVGILIVFLIQSMRCPSLTCLGLSVKSSFMETGIMIHQFSCRYMKFANLSTYAVLLSRGELLKRV